MVMTIVFRLVVMESQWLKNVKNQNEDTRTIDSVLRLITTSDGNMNLDGCNHSTLSTPAPSCTPTQHATVFDFNETDVESSAIDVLKCKFDWNKNENNIYDCWHTYYIVKEQVF